MSEKGTRKITIIGQLIEKNINTKQAAELLELSTRQIMRLKAEANANGTMSILHKNRGRKPSNTLPGKLLIHSLDYTNQNLMDTTFAIQQMSLQKMREYMFRQVL